MKKYVIKSCDKTKEILPLLEEITSQGVPQGTEIVYQARNIVYKMPFGDCMVNVKAFRRPNLINRVIYAKVRKGCLMLDSYYLSRHIEAQEMRYWERKADCIPLLKALALEMVKLHRANVLHKDFSPGNILYTGNAEEGYRFYYVDLNRMKFGVKSRKKLMSMFRSINLDERETARLAGFYAQALGEDREKIVAQALGALYQYLESRSRRAKAKRLIKRFSQCK